MPRSEAIHVVPVQECEIGAQEPTQTAEDRRFWGELAPHAVVFASCSLRKALLKYVELHDYDLSCLEHVPFLQNQLPTDVAELTNPLEFQKRIEELIPNGDGTIQESILIGDWHGVPVYMVPSDGETDVPDVMLQARNKVNAVKAKFPGKRVLLYGSDTAGDVLYSEESGGSVVHLSKPRNFRGALPSFENGHLSVDRDDPDSEARFLEEYKAWLYSEDARQLTHTLATYMLMLAEDGETVVFEAELETKLQFDLTELRSALEHIIIFAESAGGGVAQQLINWIKNVLDQINEISQHRRVMYASSANEVRASHEMSDVQMVQALRGLAAKSRNPATLYHIMGSHGWFVTYVLQRLAA
ncbi:hypothetical protein KA012_02700 [Candidatus Woesebacteria bacterium]|nr:hypothetical protein [Candidatus Woesebacteria bacterium]